MTNINVRLENGDAAFLAGGAVVPRPAKPLGVVQHGLERAEGPLSVGVLADGRLVLNALVLTASAAW